MAAGSAFGNTAWQRALITLTAIVAGALLIAGLYWAQVVLIPFALAVYMAFLLGMPVNGLQRLGLSRPLAVVAVVLAAGLFVAIAGWVLSSQLYALAGDLATPEIRTQVSGKFRSLRRAFESETADRLASMMEEVALELQLAEPPPAPISRNGKEVQITVQSSPSGWLPRLYAAAWAAVEPLGQAVLTFALVIFMLLRRENLRNRLIRLVGRDHMTVTTRAIEETDRRIGHYLLMQFLVNVGYGTVIGLGLAVIGVPYPALWGFLAGVLRYVPYLGPWIGILPPLLLSIALSPAWWQPVAVLLLVFVLELSISNFVEPSLYGHSMGVSEVALLFAAGFWTFLWGPIGLVLSGPLTVCLVVISRHVPQLWFLDVLLGDAPPLRVDVRYYQRLLAGDRNEAVQIAQAYATAHPSGAVYDDVLLPALRFAKRDRDRDELSENIVLLILQTTRDIGATIQAKHGRSYAAGAQSTTPATDSLASEVPRLRLLACPARDDEDVVALELLRPLLDPLKWEVEIVPVEVLSTELLERVAQQPPALICVGSLPPGGLAHTRYLCKRLRSHFPDLKILVGRWGSRDEAPAERDKLRSDGADEVVTDLLEARRQLSAWLPLLAAQQVAAARRSASPSSVS